MTRKKRPGENIGFGETFALAVLVGIVGLLGMMVGNSAGYSKGKAETMMQAVEAGHAIVGVDADGFQSFEWSWECMESVGIRADSDLPAPTVTKIR